MKKILTFLLVTILLCLGVLSVSAAETYVNAEDMPEFERHIIALLENKYSSYKLLREGWYYRELYSYSSGESSGDEADPEYIMFLFGSESPDPLSGAVYIGEYVVYFGSYCRPYVLGYFVYVPERDAVYTLEEAYKENINGIEKAFTEGCYLSALTGDVNVDGALNIKDVTFIQKQLADLLPEYPWVLIEKLDNGNSYFYDYMRDFNQDREINIKDATAIQKHLAGIMEE